MTNHIETVFPSVNESQDYFSSLVPASSKQPVAMALAGAVPMASQVDETDDSVSMGNDTPIVVAFADNVLEEYREAVRLSMLFADRAAGAQADRSSESEAWLKHYSEALRQSGWYMGSGSKYTEFTTSDASLTMDSIVLELLGAVAGPNKAAVLTLMAMALDRLTGNGPAMQLFEKNSKYAHTSEFQISPCLSSPAGTPITYLLFVKVEVKTTSGGALFWKWSARNLKINQIGVGLEFNNRIHERNRDYVIDYLDGNSQKYFDNLKKLT